LIPKLSINLLANLARATVEIPRIKVGKKQTIETLITEEAILFAKFLRNERKTWKLWVDFDGKCTIQALL